MTMVVTKSRADIGVCPTGMVKLLRTKAITVTAYTQPAQRGKRPEEEMALPVKPPPVMNNRSPTMTVIKRGAAYTRL
jgi:hypothetical protein